MDFFAFFIIQKVSQLVRVSLEKAFGNWHLCPSFETNNFSPKAAKTNSAGNKLKQVKVGNNIDEISAADKG